jgi:MerR family mercuric resistance operon transcriptional regulator
MAPLTIGTLAKATASNVETIRYYERIGILPPPPRSDGGHRIYGDAHLRRLTFVRRSRELGFTLEQIRGLLALVDGDTYTCAEVQALTLDHIADVRCKIADLKKLEKVLKSMAAQCEGDEVPDCPIIDALFQGAPKAADSQGRPGR